MTTGLSAMCFTRHEEMLERAKPDIVHVLTPPQTHAALVRDCLGAGAHVICEKPIALSRAEFHALWAEAERCRRVLVENHNYRFNSQILQMEREMAAGTIGEVRDVEVRMHLAIRGAGGRYSDESTPHPSHALPAGVIHEFITHLCYLSLRFLQGFDKTAARWSNYGGGIFKYDDLDAMVYCGPRHCRIRFSAHCSPDCFMVTVRGTKGWLETDLFQPYLRRILPRAGGGKFSPLANHLAGGLALVRASGTGFRNKLLQRTPYEGLITFLSRVYSGLIDGTGMPISYEDMDLTSRLVDSLLDGALQK
jgi:predicted dehydrogenase